MRHTIKQAVMAGAFALLTAITAPAQATVAIQIDRAQLTEMSDLVVRATVAGLAYRWNEDHSQILTLTRLTVTQYVKGEGPTELTLRQFGGEVDGLVSRISGEAYLEPGQDVVLGLRRGSGVVYLTAMSQSVWYIAPQSGGALLVHRDMSGLTLARMSRGQVRVIERPAADPSETLAHLVSDLRAIAGRSQTAAATLVNRGQR